MSPLLRAIFFFRILLYIKLPGRINSLSIVKELGTNRDIDITSDSHFNLLPSWDKCGFATTNDRPKRVVGGRAAPFSKFPWMVQLYHTNVTSGNASIHCGGTFITNSVILTAAHCITRLSPGMVLMKVAFGHSDRQKIKICSWEKQRGEKCSKKFTRDIRRTIIHEKYNEGNLQNDIGLIFLNKPVRFSSRVRPICLPYSEELLKGWSNTKLTVAGWGIMTKGEESPRTASTTLKYSQIHVRSRSYCDFFHSKQYGRMNSSDGSRFCAGGEPLLGSCNGDSGGPLSHSLFVDGKERVFQFGIVSSGVPYKCGLAAIPLIYTNVLYFTPWIIHHLAKNYELDSRESFSAELDLPSKEEVKSSEEGRPSVRYKNELSTGLDIDVASHPNFKKLPDPSVCGYVQPFKRSKPLDEEDYDDGVEVHYDDPAEESPNNSRNEDSSSIESDRLKRMIGGRVAEIGWFPFLAQIIARDVLKDTLTLRCGGTIISKNVILTSADCVVDLPKALSLDSIKVGNYNRNKTEVCVGSACVTTQDYSIKQVIVHKDFTKFAHQNNIALIKIAGTIKYSPLVQPICLPYTEIMTEELQNTAMVSTGWGKYQHGPEMADDKLPHSNIPKYIEVKLKPREYCQRIIQLNAAEMGRGRICGGGEADIGECNGDDGGPLLKPVKVMEKDGKSRNKYVQFGIISIEECGVQGLPTVYTSVLYYMPWIMDNL